MNASTWFGYDWLSFSLPVPPDKPLTVEEMSLDSPVPYDSPVVVLSRPAWRIALAMTTLARWSQSGATFYLLHLNDEYGEDSLQPYSLPGCLGVVRVRVPDSLLV